MVGEKNIMQNNSLPTPKELAKKEATRPISIRVKEKTMLTFEKLAQQYDTTASAMINNLLDAYVANIASVSAKIDQNASRKVMAQYLEKLASRINKFTDDELCLALAEDKEHANLDNLLPRDYLWAAKNEPGDDLISVFLNDAINTEFKCEDTEKASVDNVDDDSFIVFVPKKKYPVVGYIMSSYASKNDNLYSGGRKQMIDIKTIKEIVKLINSDLKREELAKKISGALASYESPADEE